MDMFSPHVYCLQIFICVGLCVSLYLCVHDIGVCRGRSPCAYMCTFLPISLFICVSGLLYSHMHALVFIHLFLHLWLDVYVCVTILMSVGACVCVWVCISLSAWELMSLDDSLGECICVSRGRCLCYCVHLRTLCLGIFPMCSAMSLLLLVCVCSCGTDAHFCLHTYIWQYTHVSVQLCVCEGVPGSASVGAYLSVCVKDMHACVPVCLCVCPVYLWVSVSICTFTWNVFTCVNLYRCTYTSFGVDTFVHLHGCESIISLSLSICLCLCESNWDSVHECDFVPLVHLSECVWVQTYLPTYTSAWVSRPVCLYAHICRYTLLHMNQSPSLFPASFSPLYLYIMLISLYIKVYVSICIQHCLCVYMHVEISLWIVSVVSVSAWICLHLQCMYVCTPTCLCVSTCTPTCMNIPMCIPMVISIHMHVCTFICFHGEHEYVGCMYRQEHVCTGMF